MVGSRFSSRPHNKANLCCTTLGSLFSFFQLASNKSGGSGEREKGGKPNARTQLSSSNKSGGSGEREEGEKPNARTQLSTRPSTRPHQSAPPHHKTRTIRRVRTNSLSGKADQRSPRTRSA